MLCIYKRNIFRLLNIKEGSLCLWTSFGFTPPPLSLHAKLILSLAQCFPHIPLPAETTLRCVQTMLYCMAPTPLPFTLAIMRLWKQYKNVLVIWFKYSEVPRQHLFPEETKRKEKPNSHIRHVHPLFCKLPAQAGDLQTKLSTNRLISSIARTFVSNYPPPKAAHN